MAAHYSILEFSTAVKPWLLTHLLERTGRPVLYFDPDIEIFGDVGDLADLAAQHDVVVTPHHLRPLPRDGRTPTEADFLATGIYNLGFIGTGVGAIESGFLEFLEEPPWQRDAVIDYANMMFTDQRWIDFIDCFPHHVIRDPGCNVAYWNIDQRSLTRQGDVITVEGGPLVFFHFSGLDPARPHLLSENQGERPRVFLSDHPVLAGLCHHYRDEVVAEGYFEDLSTPYGWSVTPTGLVMTPVYRRAYRNGLIEADRGAVERPPNPFGDPHGFEAWIEDAEVGSTRLPIYLYTLWTLHPDLQRLFVDPLINPHHAHDFYKWAVGAADPRATAVPEGLRDRLSSRIAGLAGTAVGEAPPLRPGLNVLGYLDAQLGVGQAARLVLSAAASAGVPANAMSVDPETGSLAHRPGHTWGDDWSFDTNVFCINADMLGTVVAGLPRSMMYQRNSAGIWFWEAEQAPDTFRWAFELVDEVWAPSLFIAGALERTGFGRVVPMPMPVPVPDWSTSLTRRDLGLPEGFVVLFTFDFASVFERKNPLGLLDAYCRAFDPDDGAHLVLKTVGGDRHWQEMELLRASIDRPDIVVMDGALPSHQVKAMMELCDCYASLHRSEGFGLGMAEAMALGKPVVATAWSANLEFMDEDTAYLVPAGAVPIPDDVAVYGGLGSWAEPDLDAAAAALRRVHDDPAGAARRGERARGHMASTRNPVLVGERLAAQAERLRRRQTRAGMSKPSEHLPESPTAIPLPPPPGSADSEVDVVVTSRDDGQGLGELLGRLPRQGIHQLFVVDRASTDIGALEVLDRLEVGGYHIVRQDHAGLSRARNQGARVSRAPFVVYLDAGTVPREGVLAGAAAILNEDSTVAAVVADGQRQDSGEPILVSGIDPSSIVADVQLESFAVLRRAAVEKVGGWDERLETGQDRDLFLSLVETGWSFAKLPSTGFVRCIGIDGSVAPPAPPVTRADGIRIAEKHRELYTHHLTEVIGGYESALTEAGTDQSTGMSPSGVEGTVHDLMDQLAAARADLARSEADGVRARGIVADLDALRLEFERRAEDAQTVLRERIAFLDREIVAIHDTRSQRLVRAVRHPSTVVRSWLR